MFTNLTTELRYSKYKEWCFTRQGEGKPYLLSTDKESFEKLNELAAKFDGEHALSAWDRAAQQLRLKLKNPAQGPQPIPANFEAEINALSSTELRTKLNRDAAFAEMYGRWAAGEQPEGRIADNEYSLTADQWRSLPPNVAARKMNEPQFRAQVQLLIDRGEI